MRLQVTKQVARNIFNYFSDEDIENIALCSNRMRRITFDNLFYRDKTELFTITKTDNIKVTRDLELVPFFLDIDINDNKDTINCIYRNEIIIIDKIELIYKDKVDILDVNTMRLYLVEEIINSISVIENFKWEYK